MAEKRLIDADDLLIAFGNALNNATLKIGYGFMEQVVNEQPTVDPESMRGHARWLKDENVKIIDADAYVTMNFELILVPRTNTYINLNHCSTPDEFKAEVIEGVSRFAFKGFTKPLCREHLDGINKLLDTHFTPEEIEYIYINLGNGINHELCMKFVKSGYDLKVIEESV